MSGFLKDSDDKHVTYLGRKGSVFSSGKFKHSF